MSDNSNNSTTNNVNLTTNNVNLTTNNVNSTTNNVKSTTNNVNSTNKVNQTANIVGVTPAPCTYLSSVDNAQKIKKEKINNFDECSRTDRIENKLEILGEQYKALSDQISEVSNGMTCFYNNVHEIKSKIAICESNSRYNDRQVQKIPGFYSDLLEFKNKTNENFSRVQNDIETVYDKADECDKNALKALQEVIIYKRELNGEMSSLDAKIDDTIVSLESKLNKTCTAFKRQLTEVQETAIQAIKNKHNNDEKFIQFQSEQQKIINKLLASNAALSECVIQLEKKWEISETKSSDHRRVIRNLCSIMTEVSNNNCENKKINV